MNLGLFYFYFYSFLIFFSGDLYVLLFPCLSSFSRLFHHTVPFNSQILCNELGMPYVFWWIFQGMASFSNSMAETIRCKIQMKKKRRPKGHQRSPRTKIKSKLSARGTYLLASKLSSKCQSEIGCSGKEGSEPHTTYNPIYQYNKQSTNK